MQQPTNRVEPSCVGAHHIPLSGKGDVKDLMVATQNIQTALNKKIHEAVHGSGGEIKPLEMHCLSTFLDALSNQISGYECRIDQQTLKKFTLDRKNNIPPH